MADRPVLELLVGDVVRLKRPHPCGSHEWLVDRLGADIGLRCRGCGRHVLIERRTLEARLAGFVERGDPALTAALSPAATRPAAPSSAPAAPTAPRPSSSDDEPAS
jgi:hypothetical protein